MARRVAAAKLTTKYQATIPAEVRRALGLHKGDRVAFEVRKDGTVLLRKVTQPDREWLDALGGTLNEWESEHDEAAYRDL